MSSKSEIGPATYLQACGREASHVFVAPMLSARLASFAKPNKCQVCNNLPTCAEHGHVLSPCTWKYFEVGLRNIRAEPDNHLRTAWVQQLVDKPSSHGLLHEISQAVQQAQ